jgi:hypothetical protein
MESHGVRFWVPLLFFLFINDLPKIINDKTTPILFADDTSLLIVSSNYNELHVNTNIAFQCTNKWFEVNQLIINFYKTHYILFTAGNNKPRPKIEIVYDNKQITTISNTKLFGIHIDDKMNWRCHIEYIGSKLSTVCYMTRSIKPYTSINTMEKFYHSCFNSTIQYGLPFWGNSPQSIKIFRIQKNIIRIMIG